MKELLVLGACLWAIATTSIIPIPEDGTVEVYNDVSGDEIVCPTDFLPFENECFLFSLEEMNFTNAMAHCNSLNAKLATPVSIEQSKFLGDVARECATTYGEKSWWIGGTDYGEEGNWVAISPQGGCAITYNDWCPGEPNNYGVETCLALRYQCDYQWEDRSCDYSGYRHICQLKKTQNV